MKYVQNRNIKSKLVKNLRLLYKMYDEWLNNDFEVIQLSDKNSPQVFEHYPWELENYPIVVISGGGGDQDDWGLDSFIQQTWEIKYIGQTPRAYTTLASGSSIAFGVKSVGNNFKIRTVDVSLKSNEADYDVSVILTSSIGGEPGIELASGSIPAENIDTTLDWRSVELLAQPVLQSDTEYFVKLHLVNGSYGNYYLMIDDEPSSSVTPFARTATLNGGSWTVSSGSTPLARVNGPTYKQLGGGVYANFTLLVEAKDLATTQKIAELTFTYLNLLRHSNVQRDIKVSFPNTTHTEFDRMASLADDGIVVMTVRKGSESIRERGNDRLFSIPLDVACYGRWTETYEFPTVKEVDIDNLESY